MNLNKISDKHPTISTSGERQAYAKGYDDAAQEYETAIEAMLGELIDLYGQDFTETDIYKEWNKN